MNNYQVNGDVLRALATYLRHNPLACDTADGIHGWWFSNGMQVQFRQVMQALEFLVDQGLVVSKRGLDNRVRYRRSAINAQVDAELDRLAQSVCSADESN